MSYTGHETSVHDAQPVELYKFVRRTECWLYTSADEQVVEGGDTYQPVPISRGDIQRTGETSSSELEVSMDLSLAVVTQFVTGTPPTPVLLTVTRLHRDDADPIVLWSGEVAACRLRDDQAIFLCTSPLSAHEKAVPRLLVQQQCPHVLYDEGCGLDPADFKLSGTVASVSANGITVGVDAAAGEADNHFRAGRIELQGTDLKAFIAQHTGSTLTLLTPIPGLGVDDPVDLFAGCNRTVEECRDKFDNVANHLGMPLMPDRNPFVQLEARPR